MAWSHPSLKEPPPLSPGDTKSIPRSALISSWGAPAMANRYRQVAVPENETVPWALAFLAGHLFSRLTSGIADRASNPRPR